jgi:hypothetical protein
VICIACDDPLAPKLNDIDDVDRVMPGTVSVMREWFRNYKTVDGKPQNAFGMGEKAMGRDYTLKVRAPRAAAAARRPRPVSARECAPPREREARLTRAPRPPTSRVQVVQETNEFWKKLTEKGQKTV